MGLRVYNTRSGSKEDFTPLEEGKVGMYVCGVTVYDFCHLGHARGAVVFDVVRRYLEYIGYNVTFVKNFTDIDDKIIARAKEEEMDAIALAERFIGEYVTDMENLGVRPADIEPRATEHIGDIVNLVEGLVEKGMAYVVEGDVYFRVKAFAPYGILSGRDPDEMIAGARIEIDEEKRTPSTSLSGSRPVPANPGGRAPGAGAGRGGTSSAPPCPPATWGRSSTSTEAVRI